MEDTDLAAQGSLSDTSNLLYAAGGEVISASGCAAGSYGSCVAFGDGGIYSCEIGECSVCPPGTFRDTPGALSEDDCMPCPQGQFSANPTGASQCETCEAGSVRELESSLDLAREG